MDTDSFFPGGSRESGKCRLAERFDTVIPLHKAKALSYMKLMDVPLSLHINRIERLVDGVSRLLSSGAGQD
jgi:hypothetical protein